MRQDAPGLEFVAALSLLQGSEAMSRLLLIGSCAVMYHQKRHQTMQDTCSGSGDRCLDMLTLMTGQPRHGV